MGLGPVGTTDKKEGGRTLLPHACSTGAVDSQLLFNSSSPSQRMCADYDQLRPADANERHPLNHGTIPAVNRRPPHQPISQS
jgi:hypothetical protein